MLNSRYSLRYPATWFALGSHSPQMLSPRCSLHYPEYLPHSDINCLSLSLPVSLSFPAQILLSLYRFLQKHLSHSNRECSPSAVCWFLPLPCSHPKWDLPILLHSAAVPYCSALTQQTLNFLSKLPYPAAPYSSRFYFLQTRHSLLQLPYAHQFHPVQSEPPHFLCTLQSSHSLHRRLYMCKFPPDFQFHPDHTAQRRHTIRYPHNVSSIWYNSYFPTSDRGYILLPAFRPRNALPPGLDCYFHYRLSHSDLYFFYKIQSLPLPLHHILHKYKQHSVYICPADFHH